MALLSATKLAPYANQIVHPQWTQQMGAYQNTQAALEGQMKAEESGARVAEYGEQTAANKAWREGQLELANARPAQAAAALAEKQSKDEAAAWDTWVKTATKGREADVQSLPADSPFIPQLQAKGYNIVPNQAMKAAPGAPQQMIAIPPAFVQATPDMMHYLPGHQVGDLVPWSEHQSSLAAFAQQQRDAAKPKTPQAPTATDLLIRSQGAATGNPQVDAMTPDQAKAASQLNRSQTNIMGMGSGDPESQEAFANAVANYQLAPLSGYVLRSQWGQDTMKRVMAANPDYHAEYYNNFNKTEMDATTGKIGTSARALDTLAGHLDMLNQAAAGLKNGDVQALNRIAQFYGIQTGSSAPTIYQTIVNRVAPEVENAYVAGGGTGKERGQMAQDFDLRLGPDQIQGNIAATAHLIGTLTDKLNHSYQRGTYGRGKQQLISTESQGILQKLGGGAQAHPTVTTQQERDALPTGTHYTMGGVEYVKK
jgi:hypothetical protein